MSIRHESFYLVIEDSNLEINYNLTTNHIDIIRKLNNKRVKVKPHNVRNIIRDMDIKGIDFKKIVKKKKGWLEDEGDAIGDSAEPIPDEELKILLNSLKKVQCICTYKSKRPCCK